ncbi:hypothetical protein MJO28_017253 [Puccinia striiformis f. sp. tritici]|nr:hypothetical protein MJO28_017253 [Puccinia striiformis f. sp. tritici]
MDRNVWPFFGLRTSDFGSYARPSAKASASNARGLTPSNPGSFYRPPPTLRTFPIPSHRTPPSKMGGMMGWGSPRPPTLGVGYGWMGTDGQFYDHIHHLAPPPSIPPSKMGGAMEADDYYNLSRILEKYATL